MFFFLSVFFMTAETRSVLYRNLLFCFQIHKSDLKFLNDCLKNIFLFQYDLVLNSFPNKPWFSRVCITSLLKTLREKEKLLVTSKFSFSHSVFYTFRELSPIFTKIKIVVCKLFHFGRV